MARDSLHPVKRKQKLKKKKKKKKKEEVVLVHYDTNTIMV
jgi:hypothetical protein